MLSMTFAGCNGDDGETPADGDANWECTDDEECPLGHVCVDHACVIPSADGDDDPVVDADTDEADAPVDGDDTDTGDTVDVVDNTDTDPDPDPDPVDTVDPDPDGDMPVEQDSNFCWSNNDCASGYACDSAIQQCIQLCNPYAPVCEEGFACEVPEDGTLSGSSMKGWCRRDRPDGAAVGEPCQSGGCQTNLVCLHNDHCVQVCDPAAGESGCGENQLCDYTNALGVGLCVGCGIGVSCPEGNICESGECVASTSCASYEDCNTPDRTCIAGMCRSGCTVTDCNQGSCNETTGYCEYECVPACENGYCCNNGQCGACCDEICGPGFACTTIAADCQDTCPCCAPIRDCRPDPSICPEGTVCDANYGSCNPSCPTRCPYGMYCNSETGYRCEPRDAEECDLMDQTCEDSCYKCLMGFTEGICIPDAARFHFEQCRMTCIEMGVVTDGGFDYCCEGLMECSDSDGFIYCCDQQHCDEGRDGCVLDGSVVDGDEEAVYCDWEPVVEYSEALRTEIYEAEDVIDLNASTSGAGTFSRAEASGGSVVCLDGGSGDFLKFNIALPEGGKWRTRVTFVMGKRYGKVRLSSGIFTFDDIFDAFLDRSADQLSEPVVFGEKSLTASTHVFEARVIGRNQEADGYKICVDAFVMELVE